MCCSGCPFDYGSEETEIIQNYGCLPTPIDIIRMRANYGKTWACHSDSSKPCSGAIQRMKEIGIECKVIDRNMLHEQTDWHNYIGETTNV
jgi:hypothetical protein